MQLGKLRSAIRKESTVKVRIEGLGIEVAVQKTDLLKALGERFDGQTMETGMVLEDGCVISEKRSTVEQVAQSISATYVEQLDLEDAITASKAADDDLLGDLF